MIRELGESVGETIADGVGRMVGLTQEQRPLPSDLLESEDAYLVVFDAPGAEPGDAQVRYEDGTVYVRIDRFRAYHEGFDMLFPGRGLSLEGSKRLPPDAVVDPDAATATLRKNGTLVVEIPKIGGRSVSDTNTDTGADTNTDTGADTNIDTDADTDIDGER